MEPTRELLNQLRREEIEDARKMTIAQKLVAGGELFDMACEISLSGIRGQNPGISDEQALAELRRRIEMGRKLETRL